MGALILKRWEAIVMRLRKTFIWAMFFVCIVAAITSFVYAYLTEGSTLLFAIFFFSSILAFEAWIVIRMERKAKKKIVQVGPHLFISPAHPLILDLRTCNEGMSCDEYSTVTIAGSYRKDMPENVRKRMEQHENACSYHQSETWHQSAIGTPVTETFEEEAMEIVRKYSQE